MLRRLALALALSSMVAVASTWPWVLHLADRTLGGLLDPDLQAGLFWPTHATHALAEGRSPWWAPELAWPDGQDVRLLVWNIGVQLLLFPLYLWADPLVGVNAAALVLVVINGLAAGWLGRALTGSTWGLAAGVVVGAAGPFAFAEAGMGRPEQALWAPAAIVLHGVMHLQDAPGDRRALLRTAAAMAACGAIYWFLPIFLAICLAVDVGLGVLTRRTGLSGLVALGKTALLALVLVLPFLAALVPGILGQADHFDVLWTDGDSRFLADAALSLDGLTSPPWRSADLGTHVRLSWVVIGLLAWGAWQGGIARRLALIGAVAVGLAMGPVLLVAPNDPLRVGGAVLLLPFRLLQSVPGFERFWWPARWQVVALAVAPGIAALLVAGRRRPLLWAGGLSAVVIADCALMLRNGHFVAELGNPARVPTAFSDLGALPGAAPIVQLPFGQSVNGGAGWTAFHRQPIDTGLTWQVASLRTSAWKARLGEVPLLAALGAALGEPLGESRVGGQHPGGARWTAEEAGGFHYVALWCAPKGDPLASNGVVSPPEQDGACRRNMLRVSSVMGRPFYRDEIVVLWTVPGVGEVPELHENRALPGPARTRPGPN